MLGPPDLVIEVLSPSTRRVDLGDKRAEYVGLGVPEYWCLDPRTGETFVFAPPDLWPRMVGLGDLLTSLRLPGLELPIAALVPPAGA